MTLQSTNQNGIRSQTVSRQDTTPVLEQDDQREVVCVKGFRGKKIDFDAKRTDVAHCITANKCHGIQNFGEDLVLCKKK